MEWIQVINCAIEYMEQHLLEDGTYKISGYKSVNVSCLFTTMIATVKRDIK